MLRPPSLTCCVATFRRTGIWITVLGTGQPNRSPHGWYTEIRCAVTQVSLTSAFPSGSDDAHVGERRSGPPIGRVNEDICDTVFPAGNLAQLNGRSARPFGHAHVMIPRRFIDQTSKCVYTLVVCEARQRGSSPLSPHAATLSRSHNRASPRSNPHSSTRSLHSHPQQIPQTR